MPSKVRSIRWGRFRDEVLAMYEPPQRAKATRVKMHQVLTEVQTVKVNLTGDLTPQAVARYINLKRQCSPNTTKGLLAYLHTAARYAVFRGYLAADPFSARKVWIREEEPTTAYAHTMAEIARVSGVLSQGISDWKNHRLFALFSTVAFTGLRRSEALHLQIHDFEAETGCLFVSPRRRLKTTGSAAPVPCPDELLSILATWVPRTGSIWLFPGTRGTCPWTSGEPGKKPLDQLKAAGKQCKLARPLTFKSLRHTWATMAEAWGIPELMVQRVLRHTRPLTQRRYRHADLANMRQAVGGISFTPQTVPMAPQPGAQEWPRAGSPGPYASRPPATRQSY